MIVDCLSCHGHFLASDDEALPLVGARVPCPRCGAYLQLGAGPVFDPRSVSPLPLDLRDAVLDAVGAPAMPRLPEGVAAGIALDEVVARLQALIEEPADLQPEARRPSPAAAPRPVPAASSARAAAPSRAPTPRAPTPRAEPARPSTPSSVVATRAPSAPMVPAGEAASPRLDRVFERLDSMAAERGRAWTDEEIDLASVASGPAAALTTPASPPEALPEPPRSEPVPPAAALPPPPAAAPPPQADAPRSPAAAPLPQADAPRPPAAAPPAVATEQPPLALQQAPRPSAAASPSPAAQSPVAPPSQEVEPAGPVAAPVSETELPPLPTSNRLNLVLFAALLLLMGVVGVLVYFLLGSGEF